MTATGHAIIGTVIAAKIGNPALAIPIALASHVAADYFPHWDSATNAAKKGTKRVFRESIVDVLLGFVVASILINLFFPGTNLLYAFVIIIAAQLLDWVMALYYFFGIKQFKWAYTLGKATNRELKEPWGIINQVAVLILLVVLAKIF